MRRDKRPTDVSSSTRGEREVEPDAPIPVVRRSTELYGAIHLVDIRREIIELLAQHIDATDVLVLVQGNKVTLAGQVQDPLDRQIAEDLVWLVPEVWSCDNLIE